MPSRKQKVEALLADLQSLRRTMVFRTPGSANMPQVTPSQWGVLMLIEQHGASTIKDVAKMLAISSSAATQLADGLVASGYLTRETHAKDRRAVILALSKKSRTQVERMKKHALQRFLKIFETLSDAEFNTYLTLNKKIVQGSLPQTDRYHNK